MSCYRFIPSAPPPPADLARRPIGAPPIRPDADGTTRAQILAHARVMRPHPLGDRPALIA